MEPKKDDPGAIPEPSDRRIEFEALFIKLSVNQGSVQIAGHCLFPNSLQFERFLRIAPYRNR